MRKKRVTSARYAESEWVVSRDCLSDRMGLGTIIEGSRRVLTERLWRSSPLRKHVAEFPPRLLCVRSVHVDILIFDWIQAYVIGNLKMSPLCTDPLAYRTSSDGALEPSHSVYGNGFRYRTHHQMRYQLQYRAALLMRMAGRQSMTTISTPAPTATYIQ